MKITKNKNLKDYKVNTLELKGKHKCSGHTISLDLEIDIFS